MCKPEALIEAIRKSFIGSEQVYTYGSCIMFHFILKTAYPSAVPFWSDKARHMITKIGNKYYDIQGEVKKTSDYARPTEEWSSVPISVAFPSKGEKRYRFTTPKKL